MLVCLECNIEYEEGKTVCRFCGNPLTRKEESSTSKKNMNGTEEKPSEGKLTCPNCNITYEFGNSCIKCGLALVTENSPQSKEELKETLQPEFEIKPSQEQTFPEPLPQAPREKLFCPICKIIYERGESCVRCGASLVTQIPLQEKEKPEIPPPCEVEIKESKKEVVPETKAEPPQPRSLEGQPTKKIANDAEKRLSFPRKRKKDYRHLCFEAGSILILAVAIGYLVWSVYSIILANQSGANSPPPKESVSPINPHSTNSVNPAATGKGLQKMDQKESEKISLTPTKEMKTDLHTSYPSKPIETEMQQIEKIKGLLENIRQANLQKNIDYFISCYATDFKDREIKKKTTLESWKNFDFLDLSYDLKSPSISGDTATARVEWLMKISPKTGGQPQEIKTILEVTFKKEGDGWRIGEIRPLS